MERKETELMTEPEFEMLDELYFIKNLEDLRKELKSAEYDIREELWKLIQKGWVRATVHKDQEVNLTEEDFQRDVNNYYFIATKNGLLAHNRV